MANDTRSHYQAVVVPDDRIELWEDETTAVGAGPHTGQPVPGDSSGGRLVLRATRQDRDDDDATIDIVATTGGLPALTSSPAAAAFRWRREGDSDSSWRGWNRPHMIMAERAAWVEDTETYAHPHCAALRDRLVVVAEVQDGTARRLEFKRYLLDADGGGLTTASALTGLSFGSSSDAHPCLVPGPTGESCYCYFVQEGDSGAVVSLAKSTDSGATWTLLATNVLSRAITGANVSVRGLRVARRNNQVLLLLLLRDTDRAITADYMEQWASADEGFHFREIDAFADGTIVGAADVKSDADGFHIVLLGSSLDPSYRFVASAFSPIRYTNGTTVDDSTDWGSIAAGPPSTFSGGDVAIAIADDGTFYVYGSQVSASKRGAVFQSADRGRTWTELPKWWANTGSSYTDTGPKDIAAAWFDGRVVLACGRRTDSATGVDESIHLLDLGGYSTVTLPLEDALDPSGDQVSWQEHWLPFDLPDDAGWSSVTATAGTVNLDSGPLTITGTGAGQAQIYQWTTGTAAAFENIGRARFTTAHTRAAAGDDEQVGQLILQETDTTHGYLVKFSIDATTLRVFKYDGADWVQVGTDTAVDAASTIDVMWALYAPAAGGNGTFRWWWRQVGAANARWVHGDISDQIPDITTPIASSFVQFGCNVDAGVTGRWSGIHFATSSTQADDLVEAVNPDDLLGRPFSVRPQLITDHVEIMASMGPAEPGDSWTVSTAYDFPVSNVAVPSPRTPFKSSLVSEQDGDAWIAWRWGSLAADPWLGSDLLAIVLHDHNVPSIKIAFYDASSGWGSPMTVTLGIAGISWDRDGDTVVPDAGGTANPLVRMAEFNGGVFQLTAGDSGIARVIGQTWEGKWKTGSAGTVKKAVLALEDVVDGDPGSGTSGIIVGRQAIVLISLARGAYSGVRIGLPDPADGVVAPPPGDRWRIGTAWPGVILPFAEPTDWGRTVETRHRVDVEDLPSGLRRSRKRGPTARVETFAFTDGLDISGASTDDDDPDYHVLETSNGDPSALERTTPMLLEGLIRHLDGPHRQIALIHRLESGASWPQVLRRRHEAVIGRGFLQSLRVETVLGEEDVDEVVRVATITVEEDT